MLTIFVPLATGQSIPDEVKKSLLSQTIKTEIVECIAEGIKESRHGAYSEEKIRGVKNSRLLCAEKAKLLSEPYCVMQDKRFKQDYPDNYETIIKFMNTDPKIGAVSFARPFMDREHHVDIGCMVWKTEVLSKMTWKFWLVTDNKCPCDATKKEIESINYTACYYPSQKRLITKCES